MRRRILLSSKNGSSGEPIDPSVAPPLSVVFYNIEMNDLVIRKRSDWRDDETPVGIVIVPASHNRYGDGSCGVIGLKYGYGDGVQATDENTIYECKNRNIYFGDSGSTIGNGIFSTLYMAENSGHTWCVIPAQVSSSSTETKYNVNTSGRSTVVWPYEGTPTNLGSGPSTAIPSASMTASTGYALADFNGIKNCAAIYLKYKSSPFWTSGNCSNYNPISDPILAAGSCKHITLGTIPFYSAYKDIVSNNPYYGTSYSSMPCNRVWYLPTAGELSYISSIAYEISKICVALEDKYGYTKDSLIRANGALEIWSSTEAYFTENNKTVYTFVKLNNFLVNSGLFGYGENLGDSVTYTFMRLGGSSLPLDDGRGTVDGYDYVDLDLPSGILWATCNVGATNEWDDGNYYQLGKGSRKFSQTSGETNYTATTLASSDDTATQVMGGGWRMPTSGECQELIDNTDLVYIKYNGKKYIRLQSKKNYNKFIYFPLPNFYVYDYYYEKYVMDSRNTGATYLWTSTYKDNSIYYSMALGEEIWYWGYSEDFGEDDYVELIPPKIVTGDVVKVLSQWDEYVNKGPGHFVNSGQSVRGVHA